ncbi:hypothetical protein ES705_33293 [subsurface metagenome]
MALLSQMPAQDVIGRLRGVLDYSYWCGLCIVRSWPRPPRGPRAGAVASAGAQFGYINQQAPTLSPAVKAAYDGMVTDTAYSWKDMMNTLYISAYKDHTMHL